MLQTFHGTFDKSVGKTGIVQGSLFLKLRNLPKKKIFFAFDIPMFYIFQTGL